jgi:hypothetical protein
MVVDGLRQTRFTASLLVTEWLNYGLEALQDNTRDNCLYDCKKYSTTSQVTRKRRHIPLRNYVSDSNWQLRLLCNISNSHAKSSLCISFLGSKYRQIWLMWEKVKEDWHKRNGNKDTRSDNYVSKNQGNEESVKHTQYCKESVSTHWNSLPSWKPRDTEKIKSDMTSKKTKVSLNLVWTCHSVFAFEWKSLRV